MLAARSIPRSHDPSLDLGIQHSDHAGRWQPVPASTNPLLDRTSLSGKALFGSTSVGTARFGRSGHEKRRTPLVSPGNRLIG